MLLIINMIPNFPKFKKLNISDKKTVDDFNMSFPPFSDFNFTSLFSWNTSPPARVSFLNGNLVIKINDYVTEEPLISFLGTKNTIETINCLFEYCEKFHLDKILRLVPETVIQANSNIEKNFDVIEDRDQFDYIFSIPDLALHNGSRYSEKRNFINRFQKNHQFTHQALDLSEKQTRNAVINLFYKWGIVRKKDREGIEHEVLAYKKVLQTYSLLKLNVFGLFVGKKLIGVSINEVLHDGFAINLFEKADTNFVGSYQVLKKLAGVYLEKEACQYLNFEQDLGIDGLRKSKKSYHPVSFLKKYIVMPQSTTN